MPVYTDSIGASKTGGERRIEWNPVDGHYGCDGLLRISDKKGTRAYAVTEFLPKGDFIGRAFRLVKSDYSETYSVFVCTARKRHSCDCAAGTYGKVRECCHLQAVLKLIGNGWVPDPRCDPREAGSE